MLHFCNLKIEFSRTFLPLAWKIAPQISNEMISSKVSQNHPDKLPTSKYKTFGGGVPQRTSSVGPKVPGEMLLGGAWQESSFPEQVFVSQVLCSFGDTAIREAWSPLTELAMSGRHRHHLCNHGHCSKDMETRKGFLKEVMFELVRCHRLDASTDPGTYPERSRTDT